MLLRVRSSKRARNACLNSEKETATSARASSRPTLSSVDQYSAESVLVPRPRSGTLITTTADEVTPEQREAYQKRLLSRTSTTGLSVSNKGGLIYAIKKFRPPKATETHRKYLKKVCAEFCISTSMDHENIIKTIDLLRLDQFPEYCMVMEFAPGGDLFNLLTKSYPPISLHEKHCLWRQLVNGVQYMHSMGVAHRDLKPENILIDATGRILKITDFGIANVFKSVGDPNPLPCKGIIGSEPYIAPEEFCQDEYDPRAVDVWACGVIFYTMYYAAMPWSRADRKKDARFARYISDIMAHRYSEAQRRSKYDQRQRHGGSYGPRLIETPGCRRVLYGILEPDARKRLTIDQVVNDDWVSRIRYCTDCTDKQEQQVAMVFSRGTAAHRYLQLPNGDLHHQHAIPRKVKT
ncbi:kinase-like domain-containing protein [Dissophora ornata]|nr:kinase-like domain-containing protein [Dissophora ornata]